MQLNQSKVQAAVKNGEIVYCCWDCAARLRSDPPYDGTFTTRTGVCQICNETTTITSAKKLFGYHRFT